MFPVSDAYKAAIIGDSRTIKVSGSITLNDNTVINISDTDIIKGSLYRSAQCVSSEDIDIGSVYVTELGFSLITSMENPYTLDGARVALSFGILIEGGVYEYVPLGYYYVDHIERSSASVGIKCMDGLVQFDTDLSGVLTSGDAYQLISSCCDKVGIQLATTQQDFNSFANTSEVWSVPDDNSIAKCRDLIMWICQLLGTFARMNRLGQLEICKFGTTPVRNITADDRYPSAAISDFMVQITKVAMGIGGTFYSQGVEGMTMNLEANPLLTNRTDEQINACLSAILDQISRVIYTPGKFEMVGDPALDAGDLLSITGPNIDDTTMLMTKTTWKYKGKQSVQAVGKNALLKSQYSQMQKAITTISLIAETAKSLSLSANQSSQLIIDAIGGNVWIRKNAELNEILIMDSIEPDTVRRVWRWNMGGLGYSDNCIGVDNPQRTYKIAMTMDGSFDASFITTGTLLADRIVGGTLFLSGSSGTFLIAGTRDKQRIFIGSDSLNDPFIQVIDSNNNVTSVINRRGNQIGNAIISPYSTPISSGLGIFSL